jgi:hypothetical protein
LSLSTPASAAPSFAVLHEQIGHAGNGADFEDRYTFRNEGT